jgi:GNAT superfamily N-acetyltransferase
MAIVLYEDEARGLRVEVGPERPAGTIELLEKTIWGTHGALYREDNIGDIVRESEWGDYFALYKDGRLIGCFMTTPVRRGRVGDKVYNIKYDAFFAIEPSLIGQGYGSLFARYIRKYTVETTPPPGIVYGFIDTDNERSVRSMTKAGHYLMSVFLPTSFSPYHPKDDPRVRPLKEEEREMMVERLFDLYEGHSLVDCDQSLKVKDYYVLEDGGEIVAGVQTKLRIWTVMKMADPVSTFAFKMLSYIPLQPWLKPGGRLSFLKLGNIYAKPGREAEFHRLVNAVLARNGLALAMTYFDPRSPVYQRIKEAGKFGIVNTLTGTKAFLFAGFNGLAEDEIADFKARPAFFSPLDP